ncbi:MAG TPA: hypothetical protein VF708_18245 [Pyrinomonadaceae bacterium]
MRIRIIVMCAALIACSAASTQAQEAETAPQQQTGTTELRVALTAQPVALDGLGRPALAARLVTTALSGTPDAPVRNARVIIENRSEFFYTYASGWVTFYDGEGVRCGEGIFKLDALAPTESAETDLPGLRLKCAPVSWRVVATDLVIRTNDRVIAPTTTTASAATQPSVPAVPPLEINIDGETHPLQLGNPLIIKVGRRQVTITVNTAQ